MSLSNKLKQTTTIILRDQLYGFQEIIIGKKTLSQLMPVESSYNKEGGSYFVHFLHSRKSQIVFLGGSNKVPIGALIILIWPYVPSSTKSNDDDDNDDDISNDHLFSFFKKPKHGRHGSNIKSMTTQCHQVIQNSCNFSK